MAKRAVKTNDQRLCFIEQGHAEFFNIIRKKFVFHSNDWLLPSWSKYPYYNPRQAQACKRKGTVWFLDIKTPACQKFFCCSAETAKILKKAKKKISPLAFRCLKTIRYTKKSDVLRLQADLFTGVTMIVVFIIWKL